MLLETHFVKKKRGKRCSINVWFTGFVDPRGRDVMARDVMAASDFKLGDACLGRAQGILGQYNLTPCKR